MMKTIGQTAKLTGISVRTLHYYDEIGLLPPAKTTQAGYRLYDDAALARLQQILFFRELDFPLDEISQILASPLFDPQHALRRHRALLQLKRTRLDRLLGLLDKALKGESEMSFSAFDTKDIDDARRLYTAEAKKRWGGTDAWTQSERRTASYGPEQWAQITAEADSIYAALAAVMDTPPEGPAAQEQVKRWQAHITRWYYTCTDLILSGLAELYTSDDRFTQSINAHAPGLALYLSRAIHAYCQARL